jgi:hypothetical protein
MAMRKARATLSDSLKFIFFNFLSTNVTSLTGADLSPPVVARVMCEG